MTFVDRRERRLLELRRDAATQGTVRGIGVRPAGAPMPVASAETGYYGLPVVKEPQWQWEVPAYFFVGGAAGAAAVIAAATEAMGGDRDLVLDARWIAAAGGALSPLLLIADLGRPQRFLNMLRVWKPQSPMSVGSWTLTAFSTASAAALFADLVRDRHPSLAVHVVGGSASTAAATLGLVMSSYTGVLIGATAIPVWNRHVAELPAHFATSGLGAAVSLLELRGHDRSRALNLLGLVAALVETGMGVRLEAGADDVDEPLRRGRSGWITRAGGALSGPLPLALRALSLVSSRRRSRRLRRAAAWSAIAGSALTRFGWVDAGHASARASRA